MRDPIDTIILAVEREIRKNGDVLHKLDQDAVTRNARDSYLEHHGRPQSTKYEFDVGVDD